MVADKQEVVHDVANGHRDDRMQAVRLHDQPVCDVDRGQRKVAAVRIAVPEQRVRFGLHALVQLRMGNHRVHRQRQRAAEVDAGDQRRDVGEVGIGLRQELWIADVQAHHVVDEVTRFALALRRRVRRLDIAEQLEHLLALLPHTRRMEHELGQRMLHVGNERPFLVGDQIENVLRRVDPDGETRQLAAHHRSARRAAGHNIARLPGPQPRARLFVEARRAVLRAPPSSRTDAAPCGDGNARRRPCPAACGWRRTPSPNRPGSPCAHVQPRLAIHPGVRVRAGNHGDAALCERRLQREHRAILPIQFGGQLGQVALPERPLERQCEQVDQPGSAWSSPWPVTTVGWCPRPPRRRSPG